MKERPKVLMTGGGTGGHLLPALAVCERAIAEQAFAPTIAHTGRAIEKSILDQHHIPQLETPPWAFDLRSGLPGLWQGWKEALSYAQHKLEEIRPRCVVGLGGRATLHKKNAASRATIPTVLLEQNVIPGWANQILWRSVTRICVSFDETASYFRHHAKCIVTGNPLRSSITDRALFPPLIHKDPQTLLVLGGSQGAMHINEAVLEALPKLHSRQPNLLSHWKLHHQVGHAKLDAIPRLTDTSTRLGLTANVVPYIEDMASAYHNASLVITRAGATTLAELACLGLPAIIIPIPDSRRNHQVMNARYFAKARAAVIVEQRRTPAQTASALADELDRLLVDDALRERMSAKMKEHSRATATQNVLQVIQQIL